MVIVIEKYHNQAQLNSHTFLWSLTQYWKTVLAWFQFWEQCLNTGDAQDQPCHREIRLSGILHRAWQAFLPTQLKIHAGYASRTLPSASRAHIWNFWDGESKYSFLVVVSIPIALIESTMTSHRCTSPVSLFSAKRKAVSLVGLLHNAVTVTTCEHASSPCTVTDATSGLDDLLCQLIIRYQY